MHDTTVKRINYLHFGFPSETQRLEYGLSYIYGRDCVMVLMITLPPLTAWAGVQCQAVIFVVGELALDRFISACFYYCLSVSFCDCPILIYLSLTLIHFSLMLYNLKSQQYH